MDIKKFEENLLKEFKNGYYSFRFEYTDNEGNRRYEVGVWNEPMDAVEALRNITKHIAEFPDAKLTDFISVPYFANFLSSSLAKQRDWLWEMVGKREKELEVLEMRN